MRRIHVSAAVLLGLALAALPAAGHAVDLPTDVGTADGCGAGAGSETVTVIHEGMPVTITTDNFGTCLVSTAQLVTTADGAGASAAVPVSGQPTFTG